MLEEVAPIMSKSKPLKQNLNESEQQAMTNLSRNKSITIVPADKENATLFMNTVEYDDKMQEILQDNIYKPSKRHPTTY